MITGEIDARPRRPGRARRRAQYLRSVIPGASATQKRSDEHRPHRAASTQPERFARRSSGRHSSHANQSHDLEGPGRPPRSAARRAGGPTPTASAPPSSSRIRCRQHGGTMHTKAVYQGAKGLSRIGCAVLRFNFRGVGRSDGDVRRAARAKRRTSRRRSTSWPRGIPACRSGRRASRSAPGSRSRPARPTTACRALIGIAPPVDQDRATTFPNTQRARSRSSSFRAKRTRSARSKDMWQFYAQLPEPKELVVIDGADHLFDGKRTEVGEALEDLLEDFSMADACHRLRRPDARRARRRTARCAHAARRAGGDRRSRKRCGARPALDAAEIDDVILGCAMPEAEQGLNVARIASLRAGVPVTASAVTVNRFCSSGLQAIAFAAERIMAGAADAIVAGGTESMSLVPMGGNKVAPNPALVDSYPDVYLSTGLVAENHARELRHLARGAGRLRAAQPSARGRGDRRRPVRRRDRAGRGRASSRPARHARRQRRSTAGRRAAARHVGRGAREAAPGVSRDGHGHRRQLVADERRRGRGRRDVSASGARALGLTPLGALRRLRDRRRASRSASASGRCRPSARC